MKQPTMFDRTPEQEREAMRAANIGVVHWLLVATVGLLAYQTFHWTKPQSTIQTCAHLKQYVDGSPGYEREYIEKITCGPVGYRDATEAMVAESR